MLNIILILILSPVIISGLCWMLCAGVVASVFVVKKIKGVNHVKIR